MDERKENDPQENPQNDPLKRPKIGEITQEEIDMKAKEGGFGGNSLEVPAFLRKQQQPDKLKDLPQNVLTDEPPKN